MVLIQEPDYYKRSADGFESVRDTIRRVHDALSVEHRRGRSFLKSVLAEAKAHDTIALLAFAKTTSDDDELSPEVLQLWQRHQMRGHLTGISGWAALLLAEEPDHELASALIYTVKRATKFMDTLDERMEKQRILSRESPASEAPGRGA